jgi:hypothetical protein
MLKSICIWTAVILGIGADANALFMLWSPADWYLAVPGVTTTGPFNQHFIRDIGLIYLFVGTSLVIGAFRPQYRVPLWTSATLWLCGHALFHFWEVAVGICGPSALARDFAGVTLPAILTALLSIWAVADARQERTRSASLL